MRKGLKRGLLIGVAVTVVVAVYCLIRYGYPSTGEFFTRVSTALFQIGLLISIVGVAIFTRLFSFRRRMGFKPIMSMLKSKSKEEYEEHKKSVDELNEKDEISFEEHGRDATLLVAALTAIVIAILLTINQVK